MKKLNLKVILTTLFVFCGVMVWAQDNALNSEDEQCNIFLMLQNFNGEDVFYNPDFTPSTIISRQDLEAAILVAKCGEKIYEVLRFTFVFADGRGGFEAHKIEGNQLAPIFIYFREMTFGEMFIIERIEFIKDGETLKYSFPTIPMP